MIINDRDSNCWKRDQFNTLPVDRKERCATKVVDALATGGFFHNTNHVPLLPQKPPNLTAFR
ncbi:hypothetical protein CO704_23245 [Cedecea neteri]|uniref:Uncharacterized protein n=1 Tax=Cedecea neteri TaxID=158822 RepID=A0A291E412_9ENTR|nr:hypothetical protein CO704_23245 [Cedecea neteri]